MTPWRSDNVYARRFLPEMKRLVGQYLVIEAPFEEDAHRATDLLVLRLRPYRIACRVRRPQYAGRYGDQFTLRAGRPGAVKTELAKILEGWGDYLLYGFADESEQVLGRWLLGDLGVFRHWYRPGEGDRRDNVDHSSWLLGFRVADLPAAFLVASSDPVWKPGEPCEQCGAALPRWPRQSLLVCRACWRVANRLPPDGHLRAPT